MIEQLTPILNEKGLIKLEGNSYADYNIVRAYKNRTFDYNRPIRVYLKGKNKYYKLKQDGKVFAYAERLCLRDVTLNHEKIYIEGYYTTSGMGVSAEYKNINNKLVFQTPAFIGTSGFYQTNSNIYYLKVDYARFLIIADDIGGWYYDKTQQFYIPKQKKK